MSGPLEGLQVVDLTQVLAGPYCTMLLADLGATVVKVEGPQGDPSRRWGPPIQSGNFDYGGYFASVNRNKDGLVLDLKASEDRDELLRLLQHSQVLVENFRPGTMESFGLSYELLHREFPSLVYCAIRGFGDPRTGASPYGDWPAFDIIAQAMGGLVSITGPDPTAPTKVGPGVGDIFPGSLAAVGILAAIHKAMISGIGQFVEVSLYDAVVSLCERIVYQFALTGVDPTPEGNTHPLLCPYGIVDTSDGQIAIAAPTDRHWAQLAEKIGLPDLADDPDFATNAARLGHSMEVYVILSEWTRQRTRREVITAIGGVVPCGPVNSASDIFADPHAQSRKSIVEINGPDGLPVITVAGTPIRFTETPTGEYRPAPRLGEMRL
jgi:crotonobetainyl-CoA:carnitine CoA-transferase CaiB-like acyl-CoA transferase